MKRPRFFLGLLGVALTLGIIGGSVLGSSAIADGDSDGTRQSFSARVANILGLSPGKVQEAFDEARRDQQDERIERRLDHMVEEEKLESEDAEAIMKWFQERPDAAVVLRRGLLYGEDTVQQKLDYLVERGRLSESEAQAIMDWYQKRPEALQELLAEGFQGRKGFHNRFHKGDSEGNQFRFHRGDSEGNQFRFHKSEGAGNQFRFHRGNGRGNQFRFHKSDGKGDGEGPNFRFHREAPPASQDGSDQTSL